MTSRTTTKQRIVTSISLLFFLGSTGATMFRLLQSSPPQSTQAVAEAPPVQNSSQTPSQTAEWAQQAKGYEIVLQREPKNQVALEGLANARLQMNNAKGAIAPLEQLVKLNPNRLDYAKLLAETKKKVGDRA